MVASVRPVAFDLGHAADHGDVSFRKSSRKGWVIGGVVAALAAGVGGFLVVTASPLPRRAAPQAAPVFAAAAASPPRPRRPTPTRWRSAVDPGARAAGQAISSIMRTRRRPHLTDDQRKKLPPRPTRKSKTHASDGRRTQHLARPEGEARRLPPRAATSTTR